MKKPSPIKQPAKKKVLREASKISAILLAAGHGKRMRPLTNTTPKPLLKVGDQALIEHHINRLSNLGFKHIVINTAYLGEKIRQYLGNGERYGVEIDYSDESSTGALETAGGIKKSLEQVKSDPFLVINADIYTDFNFASLLEVNFLALDSIDADLGATDVEPRKLGCLVLVENPEHNQSGDFNVNADYQFDSRSHTTMTFSGIALYRKNMFADMPEGKLALGPVFKKMICDKALCALPYFGAWTDVGTPERLAQLNAIEKQ